MAKGGCICGKVQFEFTGEPTKTVSYLNNHDTLNTDLHPGPLSLFEL
jgi:hypothetical protein